MALSTLSLPSLLGCLYEFNQGDNLFLGSYSEGAIPLLLGESGPEIGFNWEVWLPARNGPRAGDIAPLTLAVGKSDLTPKLGASLC